MDIYIIDTKEGTNIRSASVHGMLWLQTHFKDSHWVALASNQVVLDKENAILLSEDAEKAGLSINYLSLLSVA